MISEFKLSIDIYTRLYYTRGTLPTHSQGYRSRRCRGSSRGWWWWWSWNDWTSSFSL